MIKTLDNHTLKRGETAWEVGVTNSGEYRPTRGVVHGGHNDITNPDKCWKDYDLCKTECDKLNEIKK